MKLLLDTHVFVWLINQNPQLGQKTRAILENTHNQLFISYFSFLELTLKASIGKLDFNPSLIDDLPLMHIDLILPDTSELRHYQIHNPDNKDPFDNLLLTTATTHHLTLVTSDSKILSTTTPPTKLHNATH